MDEMAASGDYFEAYLPDSDSYFLLMGDLQGWRTDHFHCQRS